MKELVVWFGRLGCLCAAATLCGCHSPRKVQLSNATAGIAPATSGQRAGDTDVTFLWSEFDSLLHRVVVRGLVDYNALAARGAELDAVLARLANIGPRQSPASFDTTNRRLAYWINAHNAATIRTVLVLAHPTESDADGKRLGRLRPAQDPATACSYLVDGEWRTPASMRHEALAIAPSDWRVSVVLCNGRYGGPPLWNEAFAADVLPSQLDAAVNAALTLPQVVWIDHGLQRLRLCDELWDCRQLLLADQARATGVRAPTMLEWLLARASGTRRAELHSAIGYPERRMVRERRINHAPL